MNPRKEPIDELLERLEAATPAQPRSVVQDVWRRIADSEAISTRPSLFERVELAFSRPAFAAAFVVACVLGGLFAAEIRLSEERAARAAKIQSEYVRMIAPLLADVPDSTATLSPTRFEP